jgi:acetolactate synthase-1/2/3 large subunit
MIVLMNDQRYGVIQNIQDASYGGRRCYVELHTPDYAQLCASIKLPHARVSHLDELPAVLEGAWGKKGPSCSRSTCAPSAASRPRSRARR